MCRLPSGKSGQMRPEHLVATDVPAPCHFKMRNKNKKQVHSITILAYGVMSVARGQRSSLKVKPQSKTKQEDFKHRSRPPLYRVSKKVTIRMLLEPKNAN